jgi:cytochrome P450
VLLLIGSANRDEGAFPDGDSYRIGREPGQQLASFGAGVHFCLGASLARLEARVALTELVSRVADYEIDDAAAERVHSTNVRGFATLPVRITAR